MDDIEKKLRYLLLEDEDQRGDIAVVFGISEWIHAVNKAAALYEEGKVAKLLFTGGRNRGTGEHEARNMYREALARGIPNADLFCEDRATNTLENVRYANMLIESDIGWDNISVVCGVMANAHARRALMTLRRHLPPYVAVKACPYVYPKHDLSAWENDEAVRLWIEREYSKIGSYLAKGDIAPI